MNITRKEVTRGMEIATSGLENNVPRWDLASSDGRDEVGSKHDLGIVRIVVEIGNAFGIPQ